MNEKEARGEPMDLEVKMLLNYKSISSIRKCRIRSLLTMLEQSENVDESKEIAMAICEILNSVGESREDP